MKLVIGVSTAAALLSVVEASLNANATNSQASSSSIQVNTTNSNAANSQFAAFSNAKDWSSYVTAVYKALGKTPPQVNLAVDPNAVGHIPTHRKLVETWVANDTLNKQVKAGEVEFLPELTIPLGSGKISAQPILTEALQEAAGLPKNPFETPEWFPVFPPTLRFSLHSVGGWIGFPGIIPISPYLDPFYKPNIGAQPHGSLLGYRNVGTSVEFASILVRAIQYQYVTEDGRGTREGNIATVVVPIINDNKHVVAFAQWEDASNLDCSPSYQLVAGAEDPLMNSMFVEGWVVITPDHEGPRSLFAIGPANGRYFLDSMLAYETLRTKPGINLGNNIYGITGYSGGSSPVGWALQLAPTYAPSLDIRAGVLGGMIANLTEVAQALDGTIYAGFLPSVLLSLSTYNPEFKALIHSQVKSPVYEFKLSATSQYCDFDNLLTYLGQNILKSYFKDGEGLYDLPLVKDYFAQLLMGQTAPPSKIAVQLWSGEYDLITPVPQTRAVVDGWCQGGTHVEYVENYLNGHLTTEYPATLSAIHFFRQVFYFNYMPKACKGWQDARISPVQAYTEFPKLNIPSLVYGNFTETKK